MFALEETTAGTYAYVPEKIGPDLYQLKANHQSLWDIGSLCLTYGEQTNNRRAYALGGDIRRSLMGINPAEAIRTDGDDHFAIQAAVDWLNGSIAQYRETYAEDLADACRMGEDTSDTRIARAIVYGLDTSL